MHIKLTVKEAAEKRGIKSQVEMLQLIKEKTGVEMRPSTLSAFYRSNQSSYSMEHLTTIVRALEIDDMNELLELVND